MSSSLCGCGGKVPSAKIISVEALLKKGINRINLIEGQIVNVDNNITTTFKDLGYKSGKELYMDAIRSLLVFVDTDVSARFSGGFFEFDMMSFNRIIRGIEIEQIELEIDTAYVPDQNRVIILASDSPNAIVEVIASKPHLYYSNSLTANNPGGSGMTSPNDYQVLFFKHTILDTFKATINNNQAGAKDIWIDIQHKEVPDSDNNGTWVSYQGFPQPLTAGNVYSFGDDATRDTKHHYHRILAKTQVAGQTSNIIGEIFGV